MAKYFSQSGSYKYYRSSGTTMEPPSVPQSKGELSPYNTSGGGYKNAPRTGYQGKYYGGGGYKHTYDPRRVNPIPKRSMFSMGTRGFGPFAGAFANLAELDPGRSKSASRTADAYLTQFLPDGYWDPWGFLSQWFNQPNPAGAARLSVPAGWIIDGCDFNPGPGFYGMGQWPGGPWPANIAPCNVSVIGATHEVIGSPIAATSTQAQLTTSNNPFPPSTDGRPYFKIRRLSGSAIPQWVQPVKNTLPLTQPFVDVVPMPVDYGPAGERTARGLMPYEIEVPLQMGFSRNLPPTVGTGVHQFRPPNSNEKEDKVEFPGKALGSAYGALTEAMDALECMEKAVKFKKSPRHGADRQPVKVAGAYARVRRVLDQVDRGNFSVPAFAECFAENFLTDMAVGKLSGAANRNFNRSPYNPRRSSGIPWGAGGYSTRMR